MLHRVIAQHASSRAMRGRRDGLRRRAVEEQRRAGNRARDEVDTMTTMLQRSAPEREHPPLMSCGRFSTSDPEIAVLEVTKLLAPHHLIIDDAAQFHVLARRAELRGASLDYIS